jgi:hypothetical protein
MQRCILYLAILKSHLIICMYAPSPFRASYIIAGRTEFKIMPPCRNLCDKLSYPCFPSPSPYALGLKYCTRCATYFERDDIRCPCCNRQLRYRRKIQRRIICDICNQEAFIFQHEGNFCLNCWQDRTEPQIS